MVELMGDRDLVFQGPEYYEAHLNDDGICQALTQIHAGERLLRTSVAEAKKIQEAKGIIIPTARA